MPQGVPRCRHGPDHLADTVGTVASISVVGVLRGLLVIVVSAGVGDTDIIDIVGSGVGDGAGVTVVGVDS